MAVIEQAVILAGGLGTRLGERTRTTPKPMLPVNGRPFLEYLVFSLKRQGIARLVMSTGYLSHAVSDHFRDGRDFGLAIAHSVENEPLGTGGGLALSKAHLDPCFAVLNGDTLFDCDVQDLSLALAGDVLAALALRPIKDAGRYGCAVLDGQAITGFREKQGGGPGIINGGVYVMRREALDLLPPGKSSLETDLFPLLAQRGQLAGRVYKGFFIDIGLPETYENAARLIPAGLGGGAGE